MEEDKSETKWIARVGKGMELDIRSVVRDLKGADLDALKEVLEQDAVEMRLKTICEFRMSPFADASDIAEWDKDVLLATWPPLYAHGMGLCEDCPDGPCQLDVSAGKCGLSREAYQARLGLRAACGGCASQVAVAERALDYAIKAFGSGQPVNLGKFMDVTDFTWIGAMCGFYPKHLGHLRRALSYVEAQLTKALQASKQVVDDVAELEAQAMHAGTMLFIGQEVLELIKVSLFGFSTAGNLSLADVAW
ncbi:MAG: hypothetical protein AB1603_08655, partial [Chloroflexota bacterium]